MWGLGEKAYLSPRNATDLSPPLKTHPPAGVLGGPAGFWRNTTISYQKIATVPTEGAGGKQLVREQTQRREPTHIPAQGSAHAALTKEVIHQITHSVNQPVSLSVEEIKAMSPHSATIQELWF